MKPLQKLRLAVRLKRLDEVDARSVLERSAELLVELLQCLFGLHSFRLRLPSLQQFVRRPHSSPPNADPGTPFQLRAFLPSWRSWRLSLPGLPRSRRSAGGASQSLMDFKIPAQARRLF